MKTWCNWFSLERLLYHVVEMLKIHLGRIFFWKDCEYFPVLVTTMVYLEVFEDKWSVDTRFIDHCSVHFSSRRECFSSKCNSHSTECFVVSQSLLLTKRIHYLRYSTFFKGKWNFAICFFSYWHNQNFGAAHSLNIS